MLGNEIVWTQIAAFIFYLHKGWDRTMRMNGHEWLNENLNESFISFKETTSEMEQ
jgi:hypothetical protein